jgi:hypothetical protein
VIVGPQLRPIGGDRHRRHATLGGLVPAGGWAPVVDRVEDIVQLAQFKAKAVDKLAESFGRRALDSGLVVRELGTGHTGGARRVLLVPSALLSQAAQSFSEVVEARTTNSYSSINPSTVNACGSFTPPTNSPFPDSRLSC